jgi:hypothetical protein
MIFVLNIWEISMLSRILIAGLFALTATTHALAGTLPTPVTTTQTLGSNDTTLFVGLNWTFGAHGQGVEGILGVAYGEIDPDGDVEGAKASMHFGLSDGISLDKIKLTGLFGKDNAQVELGGGFNIKTGSPFGVIGANGEYYALGADIDFGGGVEGYAGLHTIGKLSVDTVTTTTMTGPTLVASSPQAN